MRPALLLSLVLTMPPQAPPVEMPPQAPRMAAECWLSPMPYPDGAEWFPGTKTTQSVFVTQDGEGTRWNHIERVSTASLDPKWRMSGGMIGIQGWRSDKFRLIPGGAPKTWTDYIQVWNGNNFQSNKAIVRSYPDGTRFDDILSVAGRVFEHRVRTKDAGRWRAEVIYEDRTARPAGYTGLRASCASCHSQAPGSGNYGVGLIPGGDTVFSDTLDWSVWQE